jgi:hypothetical protein
MPPALESWVVRHSKCSLFDVHFRLESARDSGLPGGRKTPRTGEKLP